MKESSRRGSIAASLFLGCKVSNTALSFETDDRLLSGFVCQGDGAPDLALGTFELFDQNPNRALTHTKDHQIGFKLGENRGANPVLPKVVMRQSAQT